MKLVSVKMFSLTFGTFESLMEITRMKNYNLTSFSKQK